MPLNLLEVGNDTTKHQWQWSQTDGMTKSYTVTGGRSLI
jgi:hypothetical protein